MNSGYYLAHAMMAFVYIQRGQFEEARACYTRAREADVSSKFVDSIEAMALAASGRQAEARVLLAAISQRSSQEYISPVRGAGARAARGGGGAAGARRGRAGQD